MINKKAIAWKSGTWTSPLWRESVRNEKNKSVVDFSEKFKYLRGHWLENTLDGFRVKNGHSSSVSRGVVCSTTHNSRNGPHVRSQPQRAFCLVGFVNLLRMVKHTSLSLSRLSQSKDEAPLTLSLSREVVSTCLQHKRLADERVFFFFFPMPHVGVAPPIYCRKSLRHDSFPRFVSTVSISQHLSTKNKMPMGFVSCLFSLPIRLPKTPDIYLSAI